MVPLRQRWRIRASLLALLIPLALHVQPHSAAAPARPSFLHKHAARNPPAHHLPAQEFAYGWDNLAGSIYQDRVNQDGSLSFLCPPGVSTRYRTAQITASPRHHAIYAVEKQMGRILQYRIGPYGALAPLGPGWVSAGEAPVRITIDRGERFAYVLNQDRGAIYQYRISGGGRLIPLSPAAVRTGPQTLRFILNSRAGFAYTSDRHGLVWQYRIAKTGALVPLTPPSVHLGKGWGSVSVNEERRVIAYISEEPKFVGQYAVRSNGTIDPRPRVIIKAYVPGPSGSHDRTPTSFSYDPTGRYAYLIYSYPPGLNEYRVLSSGGLAALNPPTVATADGPEDLTFSPSGKSAYVDNVAENSTISQYRVRPDGVLQPLAPAEVPAGLLTSPPAFEPGGRYVYAANGGGPDFVYRANADGTLTPLPGASKADGWFNTFVRMPGVLPAKPGKNITDSGALIRKHLCILNRGSRTIGQYGIDAGGTLCPLSAPTVPTGSDPVAMTLDPKKHFLYVVNRGDDTISQYGIDHDGFLAPLAPPTVAAGDHPEGLAFDPKQPFAYAVDSGSSEIRRYRVGAKGNLQWIASQSFYFVQSPISIAMDPTGSFAYVANRQGRQGASISPFAVKDDGSLAPLTPPVVPLSDYGNAPVPDFLQLGPRGTVLYLVHHPGGISAFRIGADGSLKPLYIPNADGVTPHSLAFDTETDTVYLASTGAGVVNQWRVETDDNWQWLKPPFVPLHESPWGIAIDEQGQFAYVTLPFRNVVSQYQINKMGGLVPLVPAQVPIGEQPTDAVIISVPPGEAAASGSVASAALPVTQGRPVSAPGVSTSGTAAGRSTPRARPVFGISHPFITPSANRPGPLRDVDQTTRFIISFDLPVSDQDGIYPNPSKITADKLTVTDSGGNQIAATRMVRTPLAPVSRSFLFSGIDWSRIAPGTITVQLKGVGGCLAGSWQFDYHPGKEGTAPPASSGAALTPDEQRELKTTLAQVDAYLIEEKKQWKDGLITDLDSGDESKREYALHSLIDDVKISPAEFVPILLRLFNKTPANPSEQGFQGNIIDALGHYRQQSAAAAPRLIEILNAPSSPPWLQERSLRVMGEVAPENPAVGAAISHILDIGDYGLDQVAAQMLWNTRVPVPGVAPALLRVLHRPLQRDSDGSLQSAAYMALANMAEAPIPLSAQITRLRHVDEVPAAKSAAAFLALQRAGRKARAAVPVLVEIVKKEPKIYIQIAAIVTLGLVDPGEPASAQALIDTIAEARTGYPRIIAWYALDRIGPNDTGSLGPLIRTLSSRDSGMRADAAEVLRQIGPGARAAVPSLIKSLKLAVASLSVTANSIRPYTSALASIGSAASAAGPLLVRLLAPDSPLMRTSASQTDGGQLLGLFSHDEGKSAFELALLTALGGTGLPEGSPDLTACLAAIRRALESGDPFLFAAGARAAGALGSRSGPLLEDLMKALKPGFHDFAMTEDFEGSEMELVPWAALDDPFVLQHYRVTSARLEVINALAKMGPAAYPAIPTLRGIASVQDPRNLANVYRDDARMALWALGSRDKESSAAVDKGSGLRMNQIAPDFSLEDLQGHRHTLASWRGRLPLFVFVDTRCPCVQSYIGRLKDLQDEYQKQGLEMILVFAVPGDSKEDIQQFQKQQHLPGTLVRDEAQKLTRLFNARCTTETFLFDRVGRLRYHGRIDNNIYFPSQVTKHELSDAITALLRRKPVAAPETLALACEIPREKGK